MCVCVCLCLFVCGFCLSYLSDLLQYCLKTSKLMLILSISPRPGQLKTWDFVELSQKEAFGDIRVTAGVSERSSLEISCTLRDSLAVWSMWCLKKNVNASSRPSEHRRVRGKNVKTLFCLSGVFRQTSPVFFCFFLLLYV